MANIQTRVIAIDDEAQLDQITERINAGEDPDAVFADMGIEVMEASTIDKDLVEDESPEARAAVERAKVAKDGLNAAVREFGNIIPETTELPADVAEAHTFIQAGPEIAVARLGLTAAADAFTEAATTLGDWMRATGTQIRDQQAYKFDSTIG